MNRNHFFSALKNLFTHGKRRHFVSSFIECISRGKLLAIPNIVGTFFLKFL